MSVEGGNGNPHFSLSRRDFLVGGLSAFGSLYFGPDSPAASKESELSTFPLHRLRKELRGQAFSQSNPDFDQLVFGDLWNKLQPDRKPQVVARVVDDQDVVAAIKFARSHNLKVAVRGGGHNWCNPSLRKGGMLIDLSDLNQVISLDVDGRRAVVQPIISNRDIQKVLNAHGLAYPSGHCPQVKLSGYLLSGGMSWNQGVWGPGAASVEAIELVTASGELIKASASAHQDYFWVARGAGSDFFGVVTRYHLNLYPLPKYITASSYVYAYDDCLALAKWAREVAVQLPSNVEFSFWLAEAPAELKEKAGLRNGKVCMVTATTFADSKEEARAATNLLGRCPLIEKSLSRTENEPVDFEKLFDFSGSLWRQGRRNQVQAMFSNSPLEEIIGAVKEHFLAVESAETVLMYALFTGSTVPDSKPGDAAFSMSARLYGGPWTMWTDTCDDQSNLAWHRKTLALLQPYTAGYYLGETDIVSCPDKIKTAFSTDNYKRLCQLRDKLDPQGLFFRQGEGLS